MLAQLLGSSASDFPVIQLLLAWIVLGAIYDKFVGKLVPAVCWGFVALPDDDRLPDPVDGIHNGG